MYAPKTSSEGRLRRMSIMFQATIWSILPPVIAIALALVTKEVYSSLFAGIVIGALFYAGFNLEVALVHIFNDESRLFYHLERLWADGGNLQKFNDKTNQFED